VTAGSAGCKRAISDALREGLWLIEAYHRPLSECQGLRGLSFLVQRVLCNGLVRVSRKSVDKVQVYRSLLRQYDLQEF
jgi:hypothetical protein